MAYPESLHPYLPSTDDTQTWTGDAGTRFLLVTFDARTSTWLTLDHLYVTNSTGWSAGYLDNYTPVHSSFEGTELSGKTVIVAGNSLKIRLTSVPYSAGDWGYAVTKIQEFADYPPNSPDYGPIINDEFDDAHTGADSPRQDHIGPFESGSNIYVVLSAGVYKSTDAGLTWSPQDADGAPSHASEGCVYDGSRYIWMAWKHDADQTIAICKFDTSNDTYGSVTYGPVCGQFDFIKLIDSSTARIFYTKPLPALKGLDTVTYNGSWGTPTAVSINGPVYLQVCMDSAGTSHVIYYEDGYPAMKFYYAQVASDGTVGTPINFKTVTVSGENGEPYAWGNPAIAGTRMLFPYSAHDSTMGRRPSWMWVDPYTDAAPTLTLGAFTDSETTGATELCAVAVGTTMYLWSQESAIVDWLPEHYDRLVYYSDDGSGSGWSSYTVFHDEIANPVIYDPGAYDEFAWNMSVARLTGDKWGVTNSFYVSYPVTGGIYQAFVYYADAPPEDEEPPTPTPITGSNDAMLVIDLSPNRGRR